MKYRARNASKTAPYVLRLVTGSEGGRTRVDVGQASDLICDEQVHELRQDLRELNADGALNTFGIGLKTDDQPAYIDLVELKLSAAGAGVEDHTGGEVWGRRERFRRARRFVGADRDQAQARAAPGTADAVTDEHRDIRHRRMEIAATAGGRESATGFAHPAHRRPAAG